MAKVLNMGGGRTHTIHFDYEKLQKRCYTCKRLNHEQSVCLFMVKQRQEKAALRREKIIDENSEASAVLQQNDPLFGVLEEEQVGLNPITERPKIAKEVLDEMRRFLLADTGEALAIKVDKVQKSVREAEKDPVLQRTVLRLEQTPMLTTDLNKGKGPVFDFGEKKAERRIGEPVVNPSKLMAASIKANRNPYNAAVSPRPSLPWYDESESGPMVILSNSLTVFRAGSLEPCSSGTVRKHVPIRRRPPRAQRQRNLLALSDGIEALHEDRREGKQEIGSRKRKKSNQGVEEDSTSRAQCLKVIPSEGLASSQ